MQFVLVGGRTQPLSTALSTWRGLTNSAELASRSAMTVKPGVVSPGTASDKGIVHPRLCWEPAGDWLARNMVGQAAWIRAPVVRGVYMGSGDP